MDETYVQVGGKDRYLYRAVDKKGNTVSFPLTKHRQKISARNFFNKAIGNNGNPRVVNIDKRGSNKTETVPFSPPNTLYIPPLLLVSRMD